MLGITHTIDPKVGQLGVIVEHEDEYARERHLTWRKFSRHRLAVAGAVVLLIIVIGAVFAPVFTRFAPDWIDPAWQGTPLAPGVAGHWLGSDEVGRDLWSRLLFGGRISLTIG